MNYLKNIKYKQWSNLHKTLSSPFSTSWIMYDQIPLKMPSLSPTMEIGSITKWEKKEGDEVFAGDILCEIQTDKTIVGMEIEEDGILAKILKNEDSGEIKVGELIGVMVESGDDWESVKIDDIEISTSSSEKSSHVSTSATMTEKIKETNSKEIHLISPAARRLIEENELNIEHLQASGPFKTLTKNDVVNYLTKETKQIKIEKSQQKISSMETKSLDNRSIEEISLSSMRKVIAQRLTLSKETIPHEYQTIDLPMTTIMKCRKIYNSSLQSKSERISINDYIIRCVSESLKRVPQLNGNSDQISHSTDISIAVATDNGLITPIVKDKFCSSVSTISSTLKDLAYRARSNNLKLDEFQGGTFSISNLGMFGISHFTAVINPPQRAILALGGIRQDVDIDQSTEQLKFFPRLRITLSYNRNIVNEVEASTFLSTLQMVVNDESILNSESINNKELLVDRL
ncbi:hypothetical protein SNEBB_002353 [Seison nebaliae]|nr:hypothetical protein SNEBB_002353 [Seison nebaliae]